jgi:cardiolipin synthase
MRRLAIPPEWRTIPNLLTFGRLLATPFLVWLILKHHTNYATALFGLVGVSDYLDGYIARRTGTVTELGTTLDTVSDRVLVIATLFAVMAAHLLPLWLGIPVLARDVALSVVFLFLARRGFGKPKVLRVGKTATFALLTALPAITLGHVLRLPGLVIFALGGILYYVAAYRYYQEMQGFLKEQRAPFTDNTPR